MASTMLHEKSCNTVLQIGCGQHIQQSMDQPGLVADVLLVVR